MFLGNNLRVGGDNSVANGILYEVYGNHASVTGDCSVVYGNHATVTGDHCYVYGSDATVIGNDAYVHGDYCKVSGNDASVSGNFGWVTGDKYVVVGDHALVIGVPKWLTGTKCDSKCNHHCGPRNSQPPSSASQIRSPELMRASSLACIKEVYDQLVNFFGGGVFGDDGVLRGVRQSTAASNLLTNSPPDLGTQSSTNDKPAKK